MTGYAVEKDHTEGKKKIGWAVLLVVTLKLVLHLYTNIAGGYGYFRDELYYLACAEHLDAGYVDHPPLSIFLLALNRILLGDSLFALRLLPAIAGALSVWITARLAQQMGGGVGAQTLAALAVTISPVFLGMQTIYSMNAFEILAWITGAYLLVRIINEREGRLWVSLGLVLGLGLLNKIGVLFFCFGIGAGLLLTRERVWFKTRWPWIGAAVALSVFSPYIVWNVLHDFAHLEFIRNASAGKYSGLSMTRFLIDQLMLNNPFSIPLWSTGLFAFGFAASMKRYRVLGLAFLGAAVVLLVNGTSKAEYLSPAFPILFAGGAVLLEDLSNRTGRSWIREAVMALMIPGVMVIPFGLPILPVGAYISYTSALGISPSSPEDKQLSELPQFYADMFGWKEQAESIFRAYQSLSEEEKSECVIYADNYGRAGAVDFFGKTLGLPHAISGHNSYWLWGPPKNSGVGVVIILDNAMETKNAVFDSVETMNTHYVRYVMPYENNLTVYVCRGLRVPINDIWKEAKHYE
jgi:hypothetical protein